MGSVRLAALRLLEAWERDETYLNLAMNAPFVRELSREERGFLTGLLYGTVERRITLDYLINELKFKKLSMQYSFHTNKALLKLELKEVRRV